MSQQKYVEDEFKSFESKVDVVMKILESMNSSDHDEQESGMKKADKFLDGDSDLDNIGEQDFIVKVRDNRTVINKTAIEDDKAPNSMDKFTFMQQLEADATKRTEIRQEQEKIAQNFRKLGNDAFSKQEYEKAINMFTKAIDHVKDSPMLYNNRAISYIKLQLNKRAIIDCDFVINKIDEKNLRAWLYRATAYYQLHDQKNFDTSVKLAKKNNSKEIEYIDNFIEKLKNEKI